MQVWISIWNTCTYMYIHALKYVIFENNDNHKSNLYDHEIYAHNIKSKKESLSKSSMLKNSSNIRSLRKTVFPSTNVSTPISLNFRNRSIIIISTF